MNSMDIIKDLIKTYIIILDLTLIYELIIRNIYFLEYFQVSNQEKLITLMWMFYELEYKSNSAYFDDLVYNNRTKAYSLLPYYIILMYIFIYSIIWIYWY